MLFAAGLGTRLYPITSDKPKALVKVNGITLLERNIEFLKSYGIKEIVINVHHFSDLVKNFLAGNNNFGITIKISDESEELLETGGGLVKARKYFDKDFLVMNTDILTDLNLEKFMQFHQEHSPLVSLAISDRESSRKLQFDSDGNLCGWRNLKTEEVIANESSVPFQELAFSGIHIINPNIFEKLPSSGKFSIIKPYLELMKTESIKGYNHSGDTLIDVGKLDAIEKAEKLFP